MADVIKINLESNKWDVFVEKVLNAVINRNKTLPKDNLYSLSYYGNDITLSLNHSDDEGLSWNEIKSISLDEETYRSGNKSDQDILESLFNTIQSNN